MTTFKQFIANSKMRHDFADMIQVRFHHENGETYDTWVSGEEIIQRLRSEVAEARLKGLSSLDRQQLEEELVQLPDKSKDKLENSLTDWIGEQVEDVLGGNIIGNSLAEAIRGRGGAGDKSEEERQGWRALIQHPTFRRKVLEVAWIQLEGSFPETGADREPDDWV